ncbi:MAG: general secretion pathway protein GspB [Candidatus Omnitrophica bacterium]|nr:general secretion pathway protein GspB [Candidatus Omnitrophota bacterium]
MSIITEALKKAEMERNSSINSKEYLNKALGPRVDMSSCRKEAPVSSGIDDAPTISGRTADQPAGKIDWRISRPVIISGILIIGAIIFLSAMNVFIISFVDTEAVQSPQLTKSGKDYIEVETYTKAMYPDLIALEREPTIFKRLGRALKGITPKDEFISNFELNGIIYDADNSWAIINNQMVKIGDILSGAKILSISPQKVVLLYKEEMFNLSAR